MCTYSLDMFLLAPKLSDAPGSEHVKAWLKYESEQGGTDPDRSKEAREFYQLAWGELLKCCEMEIRPCAAGFCHVPRLHVQGDWMCSVWTTLKRGMQLKYGEDSWFEKANVESTFNKHGGVTEETFKVILENYIEFSEVLDDTNLQAFIRSAYTYANLIVVPDGFNTARYKSTDDYWDLTLEKYFKQGKSLSYPYCDEKHDVAAPFQKLIRASVEHNDALFLNSWLDDNGDTIMLPFNKEKKPDSFDEWRELVRDMSDRINDRRAVMRKRRPDLEHE